MKLKNKLNEIDLKFDNFNNEVINMSSKLNQIELWKWFFEKNRLLKNNYL